VTAITEERKKASNAVMSMTRKEGASGLNLINAISNINDPFKSLRPWEFRNPSGRALFFLFFRDK
jgi:hypothetical protein